MRADVSTRRVVSNITPVRANRIIVVADTRRGLTRVLMRCGSWGPLCQIAMLVRASPRGFSVDVRSDYTRISRGSFVAAGSPSEMSNVPGRKKEMAIVPRMRSRTRGNAFLLFIFWSRTRRTSLSHRPLSPVVHPRRRLSSDGKLRRQYFFSLLLSFLRR